MQVSSKDSETSTAKLMGSFDKKNLIIILLLFVLVGASGGVGYYFGHKVGKQEGSSELVQNVTDLLNPINAISKNSSFPFTLIGSAENVSDNSITVKKTDGESVKIQTNDQTAVTRNSKVISLSEVQENEGVTVFTNGKGGDQVATRIIVK